MLYACVPAKTDISCANTQKIAGHPRPQIEGGASTLVEDEVHCREVQGKRFPALFGHLVEAHSGLKGVETLRTKPQRSHKKDYSEAQSHGFIRPQPPTHRGCLFLVPRVVGELRFLERVRGKPESTLIHFERCVNLVWLSNAC